MIKSKKYFAYGLGILLFVITSLLFPRLILNKIVFALLFFFIVIDFKTFKGITFAPILLSLMFFLGYFNSFFNFVDSRLSLQLFLSTSILFLIYPIIRYNINFDSICKISGLIVFGYTIITFFIVNKIFEIPYYNDYISIFKKISSGSYGYRSFQNFQIYIIRIAAAPFLYISLVLFFISYLNKRKIVNLVFTFLIVLCIILSASRGLIFSSIVALLVIVFFYLHGKKRYVFFITTTLTFLIGIYCISQYTDIFSQYERSNHVKINHITSYFYQLEFKDFLLGNGLGAFFYSSGRSKFIAASEVSPLDILRYFGIILTFFIYYKIILPVNSISFSKLNLLYLILFLIYLFNSFTNPTMFNSFGMLVILWYWYKILSNDEQIKKIPQHENLLYNNSL